MGPGSNSKRCGGRRGLTLIECLLAGVILATAAGAAMTALSASLQNTRSNEQRKVALRLAETLLDQAASRDVSSPDAAGDGSAVTRSALPLLGDVIRGVGSVLPTDLRSLTLQQDRVDANGVAVTGSPAETDATVYERGVTIRAADQADRSLPPTMLEIAVEVVTPSGGRVTLRRLVDGA